MKDGYVIRKPTVIHSRSRARRSAEAKSKGRHSGYGALPSRHANPADQQLRLQWHSDQRCASGELRRLQAAGAVAEHVSRRPG